MKKKFYFVTTIRKVHVLIQRHPIIQIFSVDLPLSIIYVLSAGRKTKSNKHIQILPLNALFTANDKKSVGQAILACVALQMFQK